MAELILTPEEKAANSFLDWDDETIGKMVKSLSLKLIEHSTAPVISHSAALLLVGVAHDANAETMTLDLDGATREERPLGDWKVYVTRNPNLKLRGSLWHRFTHFPSNLFPGERLTEMVTVIKQKDDGEYDTSIELKNGFKDGAHLLNNEVE